MTFEEWFADKGIDNKNLFPEAAAWFKNEMHGAWKAATAAERKRAVKVCRGTYELGQDCIVAANLIEEG